VVAGGTGDIASSFEGIHYLREIAQLNTRWRAGAELPVVFTTIDWAQPSELIRSVHFRFDGPGYPDTQIGKLHDVAEAEPYSGLFESLRVFHAPAPWNPWISIREIFLGPPHQQHQTICHTHAYFCFF
jgi:hypothetical protein